MAQENTTARSIANKSLDTRRGEQAASIPEYLVILVTLGFATIAITSLLGETSSALFGRAGQEVAALGGGSSTNNDNPGSIVGYDCEASAAIGVWLEGLCPCGGPGEIPCPAFHLEKGIVGSHQDLQSVEFEVGEPSGPFANEHTAVEIR